MNPFAILQKLSRGTEGSEGLRGSEEHLENYIVQSEPRNR